jgi:hypothetical protein
MEFFLGFYDMLEGDLLRIVEESRQSGKIIGALNSTFIALIPKAKTPLHLKNLGLFHYAILFINSFQKSLLTSLKVFCLVLFQRTIWLSFQ